MPKFFLRFEHHDTQENGKNKQVDTTLQLKIQSYSNNVTWNTLDGDQKWSFLHSWVPKTMILYSG